MLALLSASAALCTVSLLAQDTPVTGARITLVQTMEPTLEVTIENRRDSPLIAWSVTSGRSTYSSYAPVAPRARHTAIVKTPGMTSTPGVLTLAAFADGYYEGVGDALKTWVTRREERIADLGFWTRAFMSAPKVSADDLRKFLSDRQMERAGLARRDDSQIAARVSALLQQYPQGPDIWPPLGRLRKDVEEQFTVAAVAPPTGTKPGAVDAVTAVAIVSSQMKESKTASIVLENLRDAAIEAVQFEFVDEATNRSLGGSGTDYCLSDPADKVRGQGRIQPGERRDFPMVSPDRGAPRIAFVLYDDLSFEGRQSERDELLRRRDARAEEYAFAIAALKESAGKPAGDIEAFLSAKRVERARQLVAAGRPGSVSEPMDEILRQVKASPETFVAGAASYRELLEQQLQRLRRHLKQSGAHGASGPTIRGTFERLVAEGAFAQFELTRSADRGLPGVKDGDTVYRASLPQFRPGAARNGFTVAIVDSGSTATLFVDANVDGELREDERHALVFDAGVNPREMVSVPIRAGRGTPELPFRCGASRRGSPAAPRWFLSFTASFRAQGYAEIGGRKTLVSLPYSTQGGAAVRRGMIGVDANGDGVIEQSGLLKTGETRFVDDERYVFRVQDRYVSFDAADFAGGWFVLREHPPEDYRIIEFGIGTALPDFTFTDQHGAAGKLSDYKGKHVLLDFWGTWCVACVREIPALKELRERYQSRGFDILGMDLEHGVSAEHVKTFLEDRGIPWRNARPETVYDLIRNRLRITAFPTHILVGPDGVIVDIISFDGDLAGALERAFSRKPH